MKNELAEEDFTVLELYLTIDLSVLHDGMDQEEEVGQGHLPGEGSGCVLNAFSLQQRIEQSERRELGGPAV